MNKYQEIYSSTDEDISQKELLEALNTSTTWEDLYWLAKIMMVGNYDVTDEQIIHTLEHCLFAGLSVTDKENFYDANECLSRLYIRYGMYREASSKLMVLIYNFDCPDWVHLYFATTQLHTMFERIAEEPKFFFERLLAVDFYNYETRTEVRNIFSKYLYALTEKKYKGKMAIGEIIQFAERIRFTSSNEFKRFHKIVCPNMPYMQLSDDTDVRLQEANLTAKKELLAIEEELANREKEIERLRQENRAYAESKEKAEAELEQVKKAAMQPQNIQDIYGQISYLFNFDMKYHLADMLTKKFMQNCPKNYWNIKVKKSLKMIDRWKCDKYKEISDFAIDAILRIYRLNFDDFYTYESLAKRSAEQTLRTIQNVRNDWVGHLEDGRMEKESVVTDLNTIIEFIQQIEMPRELQKKYIELRNTVKKMDWTVT